MLEEEERAHHLAKVRLQRPGLLALLAYTGTPEAQGLDTCWGFACACVALGSPSRPAHRTGHCRGCVPGRRGRRGGRQGLAHAEGSELCRGEPGELPCLGFLPGWEKAPAEHFALRQVRGGLSDLKVE